MAKKLTNKKLASEILNAFDKADTKKIEKLKADYAKALASEDFAKELYINDKSKQFKDAEDARKWFDANIGNVSFSEDKDEDKDEDEVDKKINIVTIPKPETRIVNATNTDSQSVPANSTELVNSDNTSKTDNNSGYVYGQVHPKDDMDYSDLKKKNFDQYATYAGAAKYYGLDQDKPTPEFLADLINNGWWVKSNRRTSDIISGFLAAPGMAAKVAELSPDHKDQIMEEAKKKQAAMGITSEEKTEAVPTNDTAKSLAQSVVSKESPWDKISSKLDNIKSSGAQAKDYDAYKQGQWDANNPKPADGIYSKPVAQAKANDADATYKAQQEYDRQSKNNQLRYGVNGTNGRIGYDSTINRGIDAAKAIGNIFTTDKNDEQLNAYRDLKDQVKDRIDSTKTAQKQFNQFTKDTGKALANKQTELEGQLKQNQADIDAYNQANPDSYIIKKGQFEDNSQKLDDYDKQLSDMQTLMANSGSTPEAQQQFEYASAEYEDLKARQDELGKQIAEMAGNMSPEELQNANNMLKNNVDLRNQIGTVADQIITVNQGLMSSLKESLPGIAQSLNDPELEQSFANLEQVYNYAAQFGSNGNLMTDEDIKNGYQLIKDIKKSIADERANDAKLNEARGNALSAANEFGYFLLNDAVTALMMYISIDAGDFSTALSAFQNNAMNARNNQIANAETKFKTDALDAFSQANQKAITGEADAEYARKQALVQIEANDTLKQLDTLDKQRAVDALYNAFQQYKKYGGDKDFAVFYASNLDNGAGWAAALKTILQTYALNADSFSSIWKAITGSAGYEDGGIVGGANGATVGPDNTTINARDGEMVLNAEQQKNLFDILSNKSKANSFMDNAWNKAMQAPATIQEDPNLLMDKQATLQIAAQSYQPAQVPQQQTQKPNSGWGKTN